MEDPLIAASAAVRKRFNMQREEQDDVVADLGEIAECDECRALVREAVLEVHYEWHRS